MKRQEPLQVINLRIYASLIQELDEVAHRHRASRTEEIRRAIIAYLESEKEVTPDGAQG